MNSHIINLRIVEPLPGIRQRVILEERVRNSSLCLVKSEEAATIFMFLKDAEKNAPDIFFPEQRHKAVGHNKNTLESEAVS